MKIGLIFGGVWALGRYLNNGSDMVTTGQRTTRRLRNPVEADIYYPSEDEVCSAIFESKQQLKTGLSVYDVADRIADSIGDPEMLVDLSTIEKVVDQLARENKIMRLGFEQIDTNNHVVLFGQDVIGSLVRRDRGVYWHPDDSPDVPIVLPQHEPFFNVPRAKQWIRKEVKARFGGY